MKKKNSWYACVSLQLVLLQADGMLKKKIELGQDILNSWNGVSELVFATWNGVSILFSTPFVTNKSYEQEKANGMIEWHIWFTGHFNYE